MASGAVGVQPFQLSNELYFPLVQLKGGSVISGNSNCSLSRITHLPYPSPPTPPPRSNLNSIRSHLPNSHCKELYKGLYLAR